jgi:hypothetical protein
VTSHPSCARAWGNAPRTSANPPVFENGSASDPIISTDGRGVSWEAGLANGFRLLAGAVTSVPDFAGALRGMSWPFILTNRAEPSSAKRTDKL